MLEPGRSQCCAPLFMAGSPSDPRSAPDPLEQQYERAW
jgi:hypothetical protein